MMRGWGEGEAITAAPLTELHLAGEGGRTHSLTI